MPLPTKEQLIAIIGAYGLGRILPGGSTRAVTVKAVEGIVKAGKVVVPVAGRASARVAPAVGRGAMALARRNPYVATGAGLLALEQAGLFDPLIEPAQEFVEEEIVIPIKKSGKRSRSKFNRAVSSGMKAVRSSKFYGKSGKINNAKRAFSAVTRTASKINRGKKVSTKGVTGTIARAVRKIL